MEKSKPLSKKEKADYRNKLFDAIVNSKLYWYAALLIDDLDRPKPLFCAQVGEIQNVMLYEEDKDSYLLTFIDFENGEYKFARCLVKKEHLLPLFYFHPSRYENIITTFEEKNNQKQMTLQEVRDKWEELEVHDISTLELVLYKRYQPQFSVGQLVTIQGDFITEKKGDTESFTIQAGQTGLISHITENADIVEVTFWSMPFGTLALERKKLISRSEIREIEKSAGNSWKRKILIHIDCLFPLYCEDLSNINFEYH